MTPTEFCYWLQGFFELSNKNGELTKRQTTMIREHLQLVFKKVTSSEAEIKPITAAEVHKSLEEALKTAAISAPKCTHNDDLIC